MTKSWESGGKSSESIDRLRREIAELEEQRATLLRKNERKVFEWASYVFSSPKAPRDIEGLRHDANWEELREVIAMYDLLSQQLLDKESSLGEKLYEQARYDSLG